MRLLESESGSGCEASEGERGGGTEEARGRGAPPGIEIRVGRRVKGPAFVLVAHFVAKIASLEAMSKNITS